MPNRCDLLAAEIFVTSLAIEWPLFRMGPFMSVQMFCFEEDLVAEVAVQFCSASRTAALQRPA